MHRRTARLRILPGLPSIDMMRRRTAPIFTAFDAGPTMTEMWFITGDCPAAEGKLGAQRAKLGATMPRRMPVTGDFGAPWSLQELRKALLVAAAPTNLAMRRRPFLAKHRTPTGLEAIVAPWEKLRTEERCAVFGLGPDQ